MVPAVCQGERDALPLHPVRSFHHQDQLTRIGRRIDYLGRGNQHPVPCWFGNGRDHRLGIIGGYGPLPPLHELGVLECQVHPGKPAVLGEAVHSMLYALPQSLSSLELRWEPGRRWVIASLVLGLQFPDRRVCSSRQSL